MPRAIWSGSVSFGLVNVPVKLMTAQSPKDVRFNQLHDADGARIVQKRVCSQDGEEVDYAHIVKGYDLGGGRYVVIEPEELRSIDPEASRTIDIEEFVDLADIDPVYYEKSYYLVPDDRAAKPYALLAEAMARSEKVAVGRFVLRTKQYLATLRSKDGVLVLSTMLYADEVVEPADLEVPDAASTKPSDRELAMAEQLVESLSTEFDPAKYHDDYREKIMDLIERKADGQVIAEPAEPAASAPVIDLMAALEASLAAARAGKGGSDRGGAKNGSGSADRGGARNGRSGPSEHDAGAGRKSTGAAGGADGDDEDGTAPGKTPTAGRGTADRKTSAGGKAAAGGKSTAGGKGSAAKRSAAGDDEDSAEDRKGGTRSKQRESA